MNLLFPLVAHGSRGLANCLEAKKNENNIIIGVTTGLGAVAGLIAAGFFFGPPGLVAALYANWVTAGSGAALALGAAGAVGAPGATVGIGALLYRLPVDGARWEKSKLYNPPRSPDTLSNHLIPVLVKQTRGEVQKSMTKMSFLLAVLWIQDIWGMDFTKLPLEERLEYLRSFGVDPKYFAVKEYDQAGLRDVRGEFASGLAELTAIFQDLYKDLRIEAEVQYRAPCASGSGSPGIA